MRLSIEKLIYGGDGLARTASDADRRSMAVFVPFVMPGEKVEADIRRQKAGFARGFITQVVEASADRVAALCPYFQTCGGCHYQHIPYAKQVEFKSAILRETLQRIAKVELKSEIRLHASPPWNYRNRTRLRVRTAPEFALGYFRFGSHDFLSVHRAPDNNLRFPWREPHAFDHIPHLIEPNPIRRYQFHGDSARLEVDGRVFDAAQSLERRSERFTARLATHIAHEYFDAEELAPHPASRDHH